jgi:hypothetical protein
VTPPPTEELRRWQYREPVIIQGLLEKSSLLAEFRSRSTLDAKLALLGEQFSDRAVDFCVLPPASGGHYLPELVKDLVHDDVTVRDVPFSEFARRLKAAPTSGEYVYMQDGVVQADSPIRKALAFDFLQYTNPRGVRSKFWIGSDGQVFNLHYDDFVNFICMFEGTKRVTMFPPEQLPNMYHAPFDVLCGYAPTTHVQLLKADLQRYPKFRTALEHARVAILEPGDVLLIPPFWWHHVESFSPLHVMVNNFITTSSFANILELWKSFSAAVRELAHAAPADRLRARESFQRAVLEDLDTSVAHPLAEQARQVARKMPPTWRKHMVRLYEAFVFQMHGDPFPLSPGALAGFLERQAKSLTLFPQANFIADVPEMLEIPQGDPHPQ